MEKVQAGLRRSQLKMQICDVGRGSSGAGDQKRRHDQKGRNM